ncbi:hypothetical protein EGT62_09195 [Acinetobacter junii]|nr:hypothetical protein EGT62_09195 [Acinetobacter junii]
MVNGFHKLHSIKNPPDGGFNFLKNHFGLVGLSLDLVTSSGCGGGTYSGGLFWLTSVSLSNRYDKNILSTK